MVGRMVVLPLPMLVLLPILIPAEPTGSPTLAAPPGQPQVDSAPTPSVFLPAPQALGVLARSRRAGSFLLEELFEGNLEKECFEERCTFEEAREVFEDNQRTEDFWRHYLGGSPCLSQPCLNGGSCQDHVRSYSCSCPNGFEGSNCAFAKHECHPLRTDGCQHFCHPGRQAYSCSCAHGYRLGQDHKSCEPQDQCACGVPSLSTKGRATPPDGMHCFPWQVLLEDTEGLPFCSGVLLQEAFVLTTARCALLHTNLSVHMRPPRQDMDTRWSVSQLHVHPHFTPDSEDHDVALLQLAMPAYCPHVGPPVCLPERDFAEHVLVPGSSGLLSGWTLQGSGLAAVPTVQPVSALDSRACAEAFGRLPSTRVSCEQLQAASGQHWVVGSSVVRSHQGTWFLTGLLGGVPGLGLPKTPGGTLLLTRVSRLTLWLQQIIQ